MDDKVRRAEELLARRRRGRPNGPSADDGISASEDDGGVAASEAPESEGSAGGIVEDPRVAELTNDLKRVAADFANYRKRNEAERGEFARFAKADLIARLLDVLDGYDRALATIPDDLRSSAWVEGMWLIERKLRGILEAEGLEPVDSMGKRFDPYQHQAVAHVPSEQPEGTVIEEHQKAYRLHDKVIRPALVTVSSGDKKESN